MAPATPMQMRSLVFLLAALLLGCGLIKTREAPKGPKDSPGEYPDAIAEPVDDFDEDEEAGIEEISGFIRDCNRALRSKNFTKARGLLRRAERAMQKADEVTRSHPEFEDKEETVERARTRLEVAIENDRVERRHAAINELIRRGEGLLGRGTSIYKEMSARVPTPEDLEILSEVIGELTRLHTDGSEFLEEPRYRHQAERCDDHLDALRTRKRQAQWQIAVTKALANPVTNAFAGVQKARKARAVEEQFQGLNAAADGFDACAETIKEASKKASDASAAAELHVESRVGRLSAAETLKRCAQHATKIKEQLRRVSWHRTVGQVVTSVNDTLGQFRRARGAGEALDSSEAATEALAGCKANLGVALKHAGYDRKATFQTVFGKITAAALQKACAKERDALSRKQPTLRWRRSVEYLAKKLNAAKQQVDMASMAEPARARIEAWEAAEKSFEACNWAAHTLAKSRDADKGFTLQTSLGKLSIAGIERTSGEQLASAHKRRGEAKQAESLEVFLKTAKGDERAIARREGIPTRIDKVDGGRVFVYEQAGKGAKKQIKSFGFNTAGKRTDFGLLWREGLEAMVGGLNRAIGAIRTAKSGSAALSTTELALPVLTACVDGLAKTDLHPGYDKSQRFKGTLGKLTAAELRKTCGKETARLKKTIPALRWRVSFESLRDRVQEAHETTQRARKAKSGSKQVELIGAALGGFTECIERAPSVGSAAKADKKLRITTPFGQQNLKSLVASCKAELARARQALDKALAAEKLEDFLATCRGDEASVVKREGVPDRVEFVGEGRVFVYKKRGKGKQKRVAFDNKGRRVDENMLKRAKARGK